ncbi:hypothetical protein Cgig2_013987 [Carnegiea gigantea]|uniref:Leucine-rich repeat-containing N-terminal plant-type domain-containing protein n=1 Tax=Carnegiea gigantea TaxID=171969 RepID=A0A9Q1QT03_9CARY|nr:hypothetical protein Cgig2_013987 [Carnegiea gigantea]
MMPSYSFIVSFFLVLLIASSRPPRVWCSPLCHDQERLALVQFARSFIVDCSLSQKSPIGQVDQIYWAVEPDFDFIRRYPKVTSWGSSSDGRANNCCEWDGVECDKDTGHVVGLDLSSSCLFGKFPTNTSLFRLVHLQRLSLANNHFNFSPIPNGFDHLSRLTSLNLSYAVFSGQIPSTLSKLFKLTSLDLSYNVDPFDVAKPLLQLNYNPSSLHSLVHNMTTLEELNLDKVDVSSVVPLALGNLTSLRSISLSNCGLHGKFPSEIFRLPNLETLVVSHNNDLKGILPKFPHYTPLRNLDVSWTLFSGYIPPSIGNLGSLGTFNIEGCRFMGSIPASFGNLTDLTIFRIDFNMVEGRVPPSFANLTRLVVFAITANRITIGPQEYSWLSKLNGLLGLSLQSTNMQGTIPSGFANLTHLRVLCLSHNQLSGTLPLWLGNLTTLRSIDLHDNYFQGPLPHTITNLALVLLALEANPLVVDFDIIFKLKGLQVLSFSHASINLPSNHVANANATNPKFEILMLNSCNLTEFPQFLRYQDKLEELFLNDNKITGQVPLWLLDKNAETLHFLSLSNNSITGFERPSEWLQRSHLTAVFLDNNLLEGPLTFPSVTIKVFLAFKSKLDGHLPPHICNVSSLAYLDVSSNNISGELPQCMGDLGGSLVAINLRGNKFYGPIPTGYTRSCKLKIINLSENELEGGLPRTLANCKHLEVLDVARNRIRDTFPSWLGALPSLHILVLRYNKFYGSVPSPAFDSEFTQLRIIDISHNFHVGPLPLENVENWNALKGAYGPIPLGNQFSTFESSAFEGNPGLCGNPLPKSCGKNAEDSVPLPNEEDKDDESYFDAVEWIIIALGYGSGFIVGFIATKFKTDSNHDWFVKTFRRAFFWVTLTLIKRIAAANYPVEWVVDKVICHQRTAKDYLPMPLTDYVVLMTAREIMFSYAVVFLFCTPFVIHAANVESLSISLFLCCPLY